ncbi:MAG: response regulator [Chloroflexi bacterium]|nr:MAG: response regulator [Chloroflexota bacterium]
MRGAVKKVLVVDDSIIILRIYRHILEKQGYQFITANNGREALEKLQAEVVDLVVTDLMMPEMDGMSLLETIRASDNLRHIPVIMVTANGQVHNEERANRLGVNGFLTKPTSSWDLIEAVSGQLAQ